MTDDHTNGDGVRRRTVLKTTALLGTGATGAATTATDEVKATTDRPNVTITDVTGSVDEGDETSLTAEIDDFDGVDHSATVDWGDGTTESVPVNQSADRLSASHRYDDDGNYTVTVRVERDGGGGGGGTVFYDSFEDGGYGDNFSDYSQGSVSPRVTSSHSRSGSYSLDLASRPGTSTRNEVRSDQSWRGRNAYTVYVNKYDDDGDENAWSIRISDTGSRAELKISGSGWSNRGVRFHESGDGGGTRRVTRLRSELGTNRWYRLEIDVIDSSTVEVTAAGRTNRYSTHSDWTSKDVELALKNNSWGSGHNLDVAYDDVRVEGRGGVGSGSDTDTTTVSVDNVAPSVSIDSLPDSVDEGSRVEVTASVTDPGADGHSGTVAWGDGHTESVGVSGGSLSASHTYADEGNYGVTVTVEDDDGAADSASDTVSVGNVTPSVTITDVDASIDEGSTATVTAEFSDPGPSDTHSAVVRWGDGTSESVGVDQGRHTLSASHRYAEDGTYTVEVVVTDDEGSGRATASVSVSNVRPTVTVTDHTDRIDEGGTASLSASVTDPGSEDTHTAEIAWDDGTTTSPTVDPSSRTLSATHTYDENGTYDPTVTVVDDEGAGATDAVSVTVDNVPPTVAIDSLPDGADEGSTVEVTASVRDPGSDSHTATVEWGDGHSQDVPVEGGSLSATHSYADDGEYAVTVTATDDDGGVGSATGTVAVGNVAPSVTITGVDASIDEGGTATLSAGFSDPGSGDSHSATVDWGDGTTTPATVDGDRNAVSASHTYTEDGTYEVSLTVTDDDGGSGRDTATITVSNVAPQVTVTDHTGSADEGDAVTLSASVTDPSPEDTHTAEVAWDDGATEAVSVDPSSRTLSATHVYDDRGTYEPTVTVTDDEGASATDSVTVSVSNVPPTVGIDSLPDAAEEGSEVTVTASFDDPGADTHEATVAWGDGHTDPVPADGGSLSATHTYADSGEYAVTVTVTDDDGGTDSASDTVAIGNVAPSVTITDVDASIDEGGTAGLTAGFSDPGSGDSHSATVAWGDGTTGEVPVDQSSHTLSATHTYTEDGTYTVELAVTDDDGGSGTATATVTVSNVAPQVTVTDHTGSADEGDTVSLSATVTDPGPEDTHTATIEWDDGESTSPAVDPSSRTLSATHVYDDRGTYEPTVTVTDDEGASATDSVTVSVSNVPPTVGIDSLPDAADEGSPVDVSASFRDPGSDSHEATVAWGDGHTDAVPADGGSVAATHTYADDGEFTVTVTVTDDDGGSDSASDAIAVGNVDPSVTITDVDASIDEGGTATLSAGFSDPGSGDSHSATVDWGDGTTTPATVDGAASSVSASHTYTEDGTYEVSLTVTDDDGGSGRDTATITVSNVAPQVTVTDHTDRADEGDTVSLSATVTDPGPEDTHTATIEWDGGSSSTPSVDPSSRTLSATHVYDDRGTYEPTVTVTDDEGARATDSVSITVDNVPPTVSIDALPDAADEGGPVDLSASFRDPGADTHEATVAWGDGHTDPVPADGGSLSATHTYADDGEYAVTVTVTDDDGGADTASDTIAVGNVAPSVTITDVDASIDEGGATSLTAGFSDPGPADSHSATVAWGDGTSESLAVDQSAHTLSATHTYTEDGTYTVELAVTDDEGGSGRDTATVTVSNVAPQVTVTDHTESADEGDTVSLSASVTDPGPEDTHTAEVAWDDGATDAVSVDPASRTLSATHVYDDRGTYEPTVTVTDDEGASATDSASVSVSNVPPTVGIDSLPDAIDEGDAATLAASFDDPSDADSHTATVAWDDGHTESVPVDGETRTLSATHTYVESGEYAPTVTVTDDDGGSDTASDAIAVGNVAPSVTITDVSAEIDEGGRATVSAGFTDPSGRDTHTATVEWDDGTSEPVAVDQEADELSAAHVYAEDGTYEVTVTVTDDDGASDGDSASVTVSNVDPTVTVTDHTARIDEGGTASLTAEYSDPGADDLTAEVDWGTGTEDVPVGGTDGTLSATHTYTEDGTYTPTVAVADDDGGLDTDSVTVAVSNVAPSVTITDVDAAIDEGGATTLDAAFADPSGSDTHTATVDWGDDTDPESVAVDQVADELSATHTYAEDGTYEISVTVADDDRGTGEDTTTVTVSNVAPTVTVDALPDAIDEGESATLEASLDDPGADTHEATVQWGDGSGEESVPVDQAADELSATHTYAESGEYAVTVTVTDDDGASDTASDTIAVGNVAPSVTITDVSAEIDEGGVASLEASFVDPSGRDTHEATVEWGDGTGEPVPVDQAADELSATHTYAEDGTYEISLTVTDDDGGAGSDAATVTVSNVAPTVTITDVDATIDEGGATTLEAAFRDPSGRDTHEATVEWGDGTGEPVPVDQAADELSATHTYAEDGTYEISLTVTDDEGAGGEDAATVTVSNVEPAVAIDALPDAVEEGEEVPLAASFGDPGADTHSATVQWGDGASEEVGIDRGETELSATHVYADDGEFTVTVTVTDDEGGVGTATGTVSVGNVAPTVAVDALPDEIDEGSTATLEATVTDPGSGDTHEATVQWGDGTTDEPAVDAGSRTLSATHTYEEDGTYPVTVTVTDDEGATGTASDAVSVGNVAPEVTITEVSGEIDEGGAATVRASFADPGPRDTHSATVDWADGTVEDAPVDQAEHAVSATHTYDEDGTYEVVVEVTDDEGDATADAATVTVSNVAPAVSVTDHTGALTEGQEASLSAAVTDPGPEDTHTAEVDWADGTVEAVEVDPASRTLSATHTYTDAGEYEAVVAVTDDEGATGTAGVTVAVNAAPEPEVEMETEEAAPVDGEEMTFDAGDSVDPDGRDLEYEWDFGGDGGTDATGKRVETDFENPGHKTVSLTVTDEFGAERSMERVVAVGFEVDIEVSPRRPIDVVDCSDGEAGGDGAAEGEAAGGGGSGGPPAGTPAAENTGRCDVPVAIKGTSDFDPVADLDVGTLRFGAPAAVEDGRGARAVHEGGHEASTTSFAGSVGNLLVHFPAGDTGLTTDHGTAKLLGRTEEGLPVLGTVELDH